MKNGERTAPTRVSPPGLARTSHVVRRRVRDEIVIQVRTSVRCHHPSLLARLLASPLAALLASALATPFATPALAQSADSAAAPRSGCYHFEFAGWEPTLDAARRELARYGADWRVPSPHRDATMWGAEGDSLLILFPAWWPNGVSVRFDTAVRGDTLRGEALAFVPDGRALAPRTAVRAVRGRCRGSSPS